MKYVFLLFTFSLTLFAQTLEEVVTLVLKQSTFISQSRTQQELAKLQHDKSKADRYGEFDVVGSYTHYNLPRTLAPLTPTAIGSGTPITTTKDLYSAGLTYNVPLFTGFAQTRAVEIEHLAKQMADVKMKLTEEQLIYNVRTLYLSALSLQEALIAQRTYTKALKQLHSQIVYAYRLGKKAKLDTLKSEAAIEGSKTAEVFYSSRLKMTKAALEALVGVKITKLEPVKITLRKMHLESEELSQKLPQLVKLKVEEIAIKKADKMIQKSQATHYPQVALSAYLGKNYGKDLKSSDWDDEVLWQAGLNLKYNLFDFGKSSMNTQKAKIARLQASLRKEQTQRDLQKSLIEALAKIEQADARYRGSNATYRLSLESEKIEQVRYDQGASTLNDLLLAKSKTKQARAKRIESRYDYQKSIYFLDYLLERGLTYEDQ